MLTNVDMVKMAELAELAVGSLNWFSGHFKDMKDIAYFQFLFEISRQCYVKFSI